MREGRGCPGDCDVVCAAHRGSRHRNTRCTRDRVQRDRLAATDAPSATTTAICSEALKIGGDADRFSAVRVS